MPYRNLRYNLITLACCRGWWTILALKNIRSNASHYENEKSSLKTWRRLTLKPDRRWNLFFSAVWEIHARPEIAVILGDLAIFEFEIFRVSEYPAVIGVTIIGNKGILVSHDDFF